MIGLWSELSAVSVLQLAVVARLALAIVMSGELSVQFEAALVGSSPLRTTHVLLSCVSASSWPLVSSARAERQVLW